MQGSYIPLARAGDRKRSNDPRFVDRRAMRDRDHYIGRCRRRRWSWIDRVPGLAEDLRRFFERGKHWDYLAAPEPSAP
jgi:hypothetical protein